MKKPPPKTPAELARRVMDKRRAALLPMAYKEILEYGAAACPQLLREPVMGDFKADASKQLK